MNPHQKTARWAGLLYLISVITGIFSLMYVPAQINAHGDAAATVNNLITAEPLYRLGIAAGALDYVVFALLPLVLYKLLSPVNRNVAVAMVALALVAIPIDFVAVATQLDVLSLLHAHAYAVSGAQLQAGVIALLDTYDNRIQVAEIFWGLWLLPFGYLVFRSRFLPRILGVLLVLGGLGYLITFFTQTLFPHVNPPDFIMWPAFLGEVVTCLWLLLVGVRPPAPVSKPARATA